MSFVPSVEVRLRETRNALVLIIASIENKTTTLDGKTLSAAIHAVALAALDQVRCLEDLPANVLNQDAPERAA